MMLKSMNIILLILLLSFNLFSSDQKKPIEIGIDEKLDTFIPLNLEFTNENGNKVLLANIIDKPTILMFVYYECPGICSPLMSEVASLVEKLDLKPGIDYQILSVSIDSEETYELAKEKKENYLKIIKKEFPYDAWKFLTGDHESIMKLTEAAGFYFKEENGEFIHAGALIFVSPHGKITRYLLGTKFLPFDLKMAVIEASQEISTPTISKMLKFCFSYDPEGRTYVFNVTKIAGIGIILFVIIFVVVFSIKPKKKIKEA